MNHTRRLLAFLALATLLAIALPRAATSGPPECFDVRLFRGEHPELIDKEPLANAVREAARKTVTKTIVADEPGLLSALRHGLKSDELLVLRRTANRALPEISEALESVPKKIHVIHNIPSNAAEASAVHGRIATAQSPAFYKRLSTKAKSTFETIGGSADVVNLRELRVQGTHAEHLVAMLETQTEAELTVLIQHIDGGALRFADGSALPLGTLSELIGDGRHGQVWVLGCNTLTSIDAGQAIALGTGRRITYTDALEATATIAASGAKGETLRKMLGALQANPKSSFAIGIVGIALLVLQVSDDDCEENLTPCE